MNPLTNAIFILWIPVAVLLCNYLKPRQGLIVFAVACFLFMPQNAISLPMIAYNKGTAIPIDMLLAVLITDFPGLCSFRPKWVDLPMGIFILIPMVTGITEGFSPYDCLAATIGHLIVFGIPWFLGRIYIGDVIRLRKFAQAIFIGGLIYIPFCLLEMKIGPEVHRMIYGFYPHPDYMQAVRDGGFRPIVCMQHGLMLGMFMASASLCGTWLWMRTAAPRKRIWGIPIAFWVFVLVTVTVLCKSAGSLALLIAGLSVLLLTKFMRTYLLVFVLVAAPLTYIASRTMLGWDGNNLADMVEQYMNKDRASSLRTRFGSENVIVAKAMQKPILGWGPNGAGQSNAKGELIAIPDGMWEETLSAWGWIGLTAIYAVMLLPAVLLVRRFPARTWGHPALAAPGALAILGVLYALDNLMNNMMNPLFYMAMGGVTSLAVSRQAMPRRRGPARRRRQPGGARPVPTAPAAPSRPIAPVIPPGPGPLPDDFLAPGIIGGIE